MYKNYRLIIFDWEGTLSDPLGPILNCIAKEAKKLNLDEFNPQIAYECLELGLTKAIQKIYPNLSTFRQEQLLLAVNQSLVSNLADIYIVPGARELIEKINQQGISLAIATNKGVNSLHRALVASQLDKYFKVTRSAGETPPKPCPQMLEEILAVFRVDAKEALMIGDSVNDIEMAKAIEVDAIGIDFYNQQHQALQNAGAMQVFHDFKHIANFLRLPSAKKDLF